MDSIREQMELTNEISDAISNPLNVGIETDDEELKRQLDELEAEKLDEVLMGAERAPTTALPSSRVAESASTCDIVHPRTDYSNLNSLLIPQLPRRLRSRRVKKIGNSGSYKPPSPCEQSVVVIVGDYNNCIDKLLLPILLSFRLGMFANGRLGWNVVLTDPLC